MMFLEINGLEGLVFIILLVMFGIPIIFLFLGLFFQKKEKKKTAKILFILGGIYLLISLGVCGSLIVGN